MSDKEEEKVAVANDAADDKIDPDNAENLDEMVFNQN
jgi:hypothetical protein